MSKYPKGYLPKIAFWQGKLNVAVAAGNVAGMKAATEKLQYFVNRQQELYGEHIIGGVDFSESINILKSL